MVGEEGSGERASVRGDEQEFGTNNAPVWDSTGRTREMVSIIFYGHPCACSMFFTFIWLCADLADRLAQSKICLLDSRTPSKYPLKCVSYSCACRGSTFVVRSMGQSAV